MKGLRTLGTALVASSALGVSAQNPTTPLVAGTTQKATAALGEGSPRGATVIRIPTPQPYPVADFSKTNTFDSTGSTVITIPLSDAVSTLKPGESKTYNIEASPEGIPADSTCTRESLTKTVTYIQGQIEAKQVPTLSKGGLIALALLIAVVGFRRRGVSASVILSTVALAGYTLSPDIVAAASDPNTVYGSANSGLQSMNVVLDGKNIVVTVTANSNCTIKLPPANTAPTANADTATVEAGSSVDISVLANDTDPDGNALSIGSFTQPAHGTVTKVGNILRYTPTAGYSGPDTFTYYAYDGTTNSLTPATVTINVLPPLTKVSESLNIVNQNIGTGTLTLSRNIPTGTAITTQFIDTATGNVISAGSVSATANGTSILNISWNINNGVFNGKTILIRLNINGTIINTQNYGPIV